MEVKRRYQDSDPVVLMKVSPLEYAVLAESVSEMLTQLKAAIRRDPRQFKDQLFAQDLVIMLTVMKKEMEGAKDREFKLPPR